MQKAIVLIGPQGSGKSTQMGRLVEAGYEGIVMSKLISEEERINQEFRDICAVTMVRGVLLPNEYTLPLMGRKLRSFPPEARAVFDGFPREEEQARYLEDTFQRMRTARMYVILDLSLSEAMKRIAHRVQEVRISGKRPRVDDVDEAAVARRLGTYYEELKNLRRFMESVKAPYHMLDARLSVEQVGKKIAELLHDHGM